VSLGSYNAFPACNASDSDNASDNMETMVVTYHGDGGDDHGAGVATVHSTVSTTGDVASDANHYHEYGQGGGDDKPLDDLDLVAARCAFVTSPLGQAGSFTGRGYCGAGAGGAAGARPDRPVRRSSQAK
jgi:hypothetical protein